MKRFFYCLAAVALTLGFNACEGHSDDQLPDHYQERIQNGPVIHSAEKEKHEGGEKAGEKAAGGEHAKPAEGEHKKP